MTDERRYVQSAVAALDDELGRSSVQAAEQSAVIAPEKYSRRTKDQIAEETAAASHQT